MARCPNSLIALLFAASVALVAAVDVHDELLGVAQVRSPAGASGMPSDR